MASLFTNGKFQAQNVTGALPGALLYTYAAGTLTPLATSTDQGGASPNTNPVACDSNGQASVWLGASPYRMILKTAAGVTVWDVDNISASTAANIGFTSPGTGAVARTLQSRLTDTISVKDFGAVGDGTTDDTVAIQAAITFAASAYPADTWFITTAYTAPRVVDFPSSVYKIAGKLLLPNAVILQGNNSTLLGTGSSITGATAGDNVCIESAYFLAGVLTSNIGTSAETQRVQFAEIDGFKFAGFKAALNLYNCNEGCRFTNLTFYNCYQAVIADRCFYARFQNFHSREIGALAASTLAAYDFRNFINVESIESVFCTNRILGFKFSGGISGLHLKHCGAEVGTNGFLFTGEVNPLNIDSCYFETLTGTAIDMLDASAHRAVTIDNCFFFTCGLGITGTQMFSGVIGRGNYFSSCTNNVSISDVNSTIKVELPPVRVADVSGALRPTIPSKYTLGAGIWAEQPSQIYFNATGGTVVQQNYSGGLVPLPFSGQQGYVPAKVAFCDLTLSGSGASVNAFIDTKIVYDSYTVGVYSMVLTDNTSTYSMNGRFFANGNVIVADTAGKTVTVSSSGGFVRLTIAAVNAPGGTASVEGIVRII